MGRRRAPNDVRRIRALRLRNQGLAAGGRRWFSPADVARGMLAMQAQDFSGVRWAMALRLADRASARERIQAALTDATVVRNRPSRGTLQITAGPDMHWLTGLMASRSLAQAAKRRGDLGLTDDMLAASEGVLREVLADGRVETRPRLLEAFGAAGLPGAGNGASHLLRHHTERMTIVFAEPEGSTETFALAEHRIAEPRAPDRRSALAELARRYVAARGPVTARDLSWWSNLPAADVREALRLADDAIESVELAGDDYLMARGEVRITDDEVDAALAEPLLLPPFDEYLIGYADRAAILDPEYATAVVPGRNGMFRPVVVVDGEVVGTWASKVRKAGVMVSVTSFFPIAARARRRLAEHAAAYGDFLGDHAAEIAFT